MKYPVQRYQDGNNGDSKKGLDFEYIFSLNFTEMYNKIYTIKRSGSDTVWRTQILEELGTDGITSTGGEISSEKSWDKFRYG